MDAGEGLHISREGPLAVLVLDSPGTRNAIDYRLARALQQACSAIAQDDSARAVLLTGSGDAFCVSPPEDCSPQAAAGQGGEWPPSARRVAAAVAALEQPVVVAVNGDAVGQGMELCLAGDIRLAAEEASFAMPQVLHGGIPWDGGTQRLPRAVGLARALELLLTGRAVGAQEALAMGLVHQVVPAAELLERAMELARRLATYAPVALRYAKEAVLQGSELPLLAGLGLEMDLNLLLHSTWDRQEGVGSFLERRPPRFEGR